MKFVWTVPCIIAAMTWGCAGEIENPEDFRQAREAVSVADAAQGDPKAGSAGSWRDAGGAGASSPRPDAGPTGEAGAAAEDDAGTPEPVAGGPAAGSGGAGSGGAGSGGAGSGGAGSGGSAGAAPAPSCDFRGLVMMKCAGASCHGGPTASTGLDLTSPSLAMRVQGRTGSGACSDTLLVDKDSPEESALYQRVTGSDCGVRMPLGGTLTPTEQACFLSWIEGR